MTSSVCNCVCVNPVAVCREYYETPEGKREQKKVHSCATTKLACSLINNELVNKIRVFRSVKEYILHRFRRESNASPIFVCAFDN